MISKDAAFQKISSLVQRFDEQFESYKKSDYNETLTRRDFIDPFFKALGWDIDNEEGYAEAYREVIHEDRLNDEGRMTAPDYSFRLPGGKKLFFVEAKKPSVTLKDDISPAYQIRRYGWSAKLPISIITDFEEFSIYDCTKKPNPKDKASTARIKYLTFKDYISEFDFLWDTFSKEKVLRGSFDKFVQNDTYKKGTASVDKEFLLSLDKWRTYLAVNISRNNKELDEDELNFAVQQTIDRIIFLRIAEDRSIEPYGSLKDCLNSGEYYKNLLQLFTRADEKYNSGLFDFEQDRISKYLCIENKVLKSVINELYYPESPYEFSVLSVEILGNAYEQFLGKQIRIDKAHRTKIEEKPEVRKAGGVYYTPEYIVDYIVKNTVGKLVEGKTPKEVSSLKIVDPACGSGSFLIGAYKYLLDWHKDYYSSDGKLSIGKKESPLTPEGNLTTSEKKRILLNNIYGVDIDVNAVEVSKLSLLLTCMEGETEASIASQLQLFNERVLPTLDNNIKSGNSLIDTDYYDTQLDFGEDKKVKPFNWERAFPDIFKNHGFDIVLGNPPWVDLKGHSPEYTKYYFTKYKTCENRINLYAIFVEKGLSILNKKGIFGFIIPNSILYQSSYEKLRRIILGKYNISNIVRLPDNTFYNVKAETVIITIGQTIQKTEAIIYDNKDNISQISQTNAKVVNYFEQKKWLENDLTVFDIFTDDQAKLILRKIENNNTELQEICDISLGITPYDKYKGHTQKQITERVFHSTTPKDKTFKPLLEGADVKRYSVSWGEKEYLSYGNWLGAPREKRFFTSERILVRQIVSGNPLRIYAGYTDKELYNTQTIFNILLKEETRLNIKYLLAILNSKLMNFYHKNKYLDLSKNLFQKILIQNCRKFPIITVFENHNIHNEIVKLTEQLIKLNQDLQNIKLQTTYERIQTQIEYLENKVDRIIYSLYGLNENEIKIIEDNF